MTASEIKILYWKIFASSAQKIDLCFWLLYRCLAGLWEDALGRTEKKLWCRDKT